MEVCLGHRTQQRPQTIAMFYKLGWVPALYRKTRRSLSQAGSVAGPHVRF